MFLHVVFIGKVSLIFTGEDSAINVLAVFTIDACPVSDDITIIAIHAEIVNNNAMTVVILHLMEHMYSVACDSVENERHPRNAHGHEQQNKSDAFTEIMQRKQTQYFIIC